MYISNNIVFNGIINNDFIDVGEGYIAVPTIGQDGTKLPIILVKSTIDKVRESFKLNDKISAGGKLSFMDNNWVIICKYMTIIPETKEFKKEIKESVEEQKENEKVENDKTELIKKLEHDKIIKNNIKKPEPIKRKRLITVEEKIK